MPALLGAMLKGKVKDPREKQPTLPEHAAAAIARALSPDPADRFPTARELAAVALRKARRLNGRGDCMGKLVTHRGVAATHLESLFPGYLFAQLATDAWPRLAWLHGVRRILGEGDHPLPLPAGVVEDLIGRTSTRGVVDDPGEPVPRLPARSRWHNLAALPAGQRVDLLMVHLFGEARSAA